MTRKTWDRRESLLAFRLYCKTPFGKLHKANPEIIQLAMQIHRTPSAVGMKACNFASLDPKLQARGITALSNVSALDRSLWQEFEKNPERIAEEAEAEFEKLHAEEAFVDQKLELPEGPTEVSKPIRARRVQRFFRATVLASYDNRCALTGLAIPELLTASHIIPWSESVERRADPCNGLCLNALLDRAFDRGLFTFNDDYSLMVSKSILAEPEAVRILYPCEQSNLRLNLPSRFAPDLGALAFHRRNIFQG